jgi:hypothetical protein
MARKKVGEAPGAAAFSLVAALSPEEKMGFLSLLAPSLSPEEALALFSGIPRTNRHEMMLYHSGLVTSVVERNLAIERYSRNPKAKSATLALGQEVYEYQTANPATWSWWAAACRSLEDGSEEAQRKCRNARNKYCKSLNLPYPPDPSRVRRERG